MTTKTIYRCSSCGIEVASTKEYGLLPLYSDAQAAPKCTGSLGHRWHEVCSAVLVKSEKLVTTPIVGVWDNPSKFKQ